MSLLCFYVGVGWCSGCGYYCCFTGLLVSRLFYCRALKILQVCFRSLGACLAGGAGLNKAGMTTMIERIGVKERCNAICRIIGCHRANYTRTQTGVFSDRRRYRRDGCAEGPDQVYARGGGGGGLHGREVGDLLDRK